MILNKFYDYDWMNVFQIKLWSNKSKNKELNIQSINCLKVIIYIELYYSNNHTHFLALAAFLAGAFLAGAFLATFFGAAFFTGAAFLATFLVTFLTGAVSEKEYQLAKRP